MATWDDLEITEEQEPVMQANGRTVCKLGMVIKESNKWWLYSRDSPDAKAGVQTKEEITEE